MSEKKKKKKKQHPYVRIMIAASNGRGVTLDADEAIEASLDDAIAAYAHNLWEDENPGVPEPWIR